MARRAYRLYRELTGSAFMVMIGFLCVVAAFLGCVVRAVVEWMVG
jgi:hypothetical protein